MKLNKIMILSLLLVLICFIGAASATDAIDDNSTIAGDAVDINHDAQDNVIEINDEEINSLETENAVEDLESLSYSGTEVDADDWDDLKIYSESTGTNYDIILTGTSYNVDSKITLKNSVTIIGTEDSYITAGSYTGTPFVNTNSALTINFINVTFRDMSVTNLLELAGTNNLVNCNFYNIVAGTGRNAVIYNTEGTMNLVNCNVVDSSAGYGVVSNYKAGTYTGVVMNVDDCSFVRNTAGVEPGAINNCGILNVDNSEFINNTAVWWAGAIHTHYNAQTIINNTLFEGNDAGWNGGALYTYSTLKAYNSIFKKNKCHTNIGGGAIGASRWWGGNYDITIENCSFEENENCNTNGNGGAITAMNSGALNVHDSTFINNKAKNGQAIAAFSEAFENISAGIPNLKVYNNHFYNHTSTTSDTVQISGNYTFENNTFTNCYQTNVGTNNIFLNSVSLNNNLIIKCTDSLLGSAFADILKADAPTVIYVNSSSSNKPGKNGNDGHDWETAYGTLTGLKKAISNLADNGIIYLADGNVAYNFLNYPKNVTFIGHDNITIVDFDVEYSGAGDSIDAVYTFINLTFTGRDFGRHSHFINCTFINPVTICSELNHDEAALNHFDEVEYGYANTYIINFDNCIFKDMITEDGIVTVYKTGLANFTNCTFEDITADSIVAKTGDFYLEDGIYFNDCKFINCTVNGIVDIPGTDNVETYCAIENCDYDFDAKLGIETVGDNEHRYVNATKLKVVEDNTPSQTNTTDDNKTSSDKTDTNKQTTSTTKKVTKKATKITAKKATFKKSKKVKKYSIVLKAGKAAVKKVKVTLKVGKKTYKATTNSKGKATFKITKLTKKGKYTAVIKFAGNKNFKATSKKVKITVKK